MLAIDRFFHSLTNDEPEPIYSYDTIEMLNDIMEAWEKVDRDNRLSARFGEAVGILSYKFDHAKLDDQVAMLIDDVGPMLRKLAASCLKDQSYPKIRHLYGLEIADRLLHDRQICGYIASQLTSLSRWSGRRRRTTFVRRTKWPAFVKPLIVARDRGKCAICKTDITGELLAKAHIDHIETLAAGGCNDVVNIQLCCEMCNLTKGAGAADVANSIPRYHQRRRLQSKPDDLRRSAFATAKRAGYF
jgi:hypothetical protein